MSCPLVLSLFPGIGLLDMAFEQEGFCVVRGPDVLWGGDIRRFHPPAGKFDGVIGGPPCQAFSSLAHLVRQNGYEPKFGNLIPEFERVVRESSPTWFAMENVPAAPLPDVDGYEVHSFTLNNRQCMDESGKPATQNRVRRWSFGYCGERRPLLIDVALWQNAEFEYAVCGGTHGEGGISREMRSKDPRAIGGSGKEKPAVRRSINDFVGGNVKSQSSFARMVELQGLPADFLSDAPFTVSGKCKAVGNGVPLPMGRAIARAVKEATVATP